ncbi:hypothetical protein GEMRC1_000187 [Eukaryota sp. GEM-RC1]
MLRLL